MAARTLPQYDMEQIGRGFHIPGRFQEARPHGNGHINDTFVASYDAAGRRVRYIHQRINHLVFRNPAALMDNIMRVTSHQHEKLIGAADRGRRALTALRAADGLPYILDGDGNTWRTYFYIENARTYDAIENPAQAVEVARAFGEFQKQLSDLPGPRLHETIPDFHHTPKRFQALVAAVDKDSCNRAGNVREELAMVFAREEMTRLLVSQKEAGILPERITHNDTKLNNVMLDDVTMEGMCVIDLDTVMPGLALYDFGDLVRTATSPVTEDERDLSKVVMQMPMFEALLEGYLTSAHDFLVPAEKEHLVAAGKVITLEIGLRFLTDYLEGDTYFRTKHPDHNLERSRTQFRLVQSIENQEEAMQQRVRSWNLGGAIRNR